MSRRSSRENSQLVQPGEFPPSSRENSQTIWCLSGGLIWSLNSGEGRREETGFFINQTNFSKPQP